MFTLINRKERANLLQTFEFRLPDIGRYEQQKGIVVARGMNQAGIIDSPLDTKTVFSQRINAAKEARRFAQAVYPGTLIPSPGKSTNFIYRGNLFREQYEFFQRFGWFPDTGVFVDQLDIPEVDSWLWPEIEQPALKSVVANPQYCERVQSTDGAVAPIGNDERLLASTFLSTESLLQFIHQLWDRHPAVYSASALDQSNIWMEGIRRRPLAQALPALFEIEAAASFLTYTEHLPVLTQLSLAGNWISVFRKPLSEIRQSELCLTSRIHDELLNLGSGRFASDRDQRV
jgi:hypothetical protein